MAFCDLVRQGAGVDRAGDALKHGNAYGSSPHGGVLVVAGDDHGCVSSSMPHQSDFTMQAWSMPVLHPGNVAEYLEFGLYGWAMSRFSGNWVGFKAISEVVESGMTVDLDQVRVEFPPPDDFAPPADGLHYRWPDLPSLALEQRLARKLDAARAFARKNSIDRWIASAPAADLGIVTCGKATMTFSRCCADSSCGFPIWRPRASASTRSGWSFRSSRRVSRPLSTASTRSSWWRKRPVVERQLRNCSSIASASARGSSARPTPTALHSLSALGELRPRGSCRSSPTGWRATSRPSTDASTSATSPPRKSFRMPATRCAGCPTSARAAPQHLNQGARRLDCPGWHRLPLHGFVDGPFHHRPDPDGRRRCGLGSPRALHAPPACLPEPRRRHLFPLRHSRHPPGHRRARQRITYKILYNDAVAMTGGQPVDGVIGVERIARQVEAEGVERVAVVSDEPEKYRGQGGLFPPGTTFHHRSEMDEVQRTMRDRRRHLPDLRPDLCRRESAAAARRRGIPDPDRRIFINAEVCEGCGDCGEASNCLSVQPLETPLGRKRQIEQSSCNKDYSCVQGFCPSFVSVAGATLKKRVGKLDRRRLDDLITHLPIPAAQLDEAPTTC